MEEKSVVVTQEWTQEQIDAIRNTVAVGANNSELIMFLSLAKKYNLDPFAKEIWCVKMGGRMTTITARDDYLKIANCHPAFDGIESDVVCANDKFMKDEKGVHHVYNVGNRGQIIGAYAIVYRTDRSHPVYVFAPYCEYYNNNNPVWRQYPSAMNMKVAESMALKRAFSISGLVTQEELGETQEPNEKKQVTPPPQNTQVPNKAVLIDLWKRYLTVCGSPENAKEAMKKITGKDSTKNFTSEDFQKLEEDIIQREYETTPDEEFFEAETVDEPQKEEVTTQEEISA